MPRTAKGFSITRGHRPDTGADFWTVRGMLNGRQERKEFGVYDDAIAFRDKRNGELFGGDNNAALHLKTWLTPEQIRTAEAVFLELKEKWPQSTLLDVVNYFRVASAVLPADEAARLTPALARLEKTAPGATLTQAVAFLCDNYRPPSEAVAVDSAVKDYLAEGLRRNQTHTLSDWQYERIGQEMARFLDEFVGRQLHTITTGELTDYLRRTSRGKTNKNYKNKTWNNRRSALCGFFTHCVKAGFIPHSPARAIHAFKKHELARPAPEYLSAERAAALMKYVEENYEGRLVPYFVHTLFLGIRPSYRKSEITRASSFTYDHMEKVLRIPHGKSKTRKARDIVMQRNVQRWLKAYPLEKYPIVCRNFRKLLASVRKKFAIPHDGLRHTYCSMLVGKYRSVGEAALQAGNSEGVIWEHYLRLVSRKEADRFWSIIPRGSR